MIKNRLIILPSQDGQDYTCAVLAPLGMDVNEACQKLQQIIDEVHRNEEWTWEDMALAFEKDGFVVPRSTQGPQWD